MGEVCCDARVILVNYQCDICHKGLVYCIDSEYMKDDNGDGHMIYTHRCPVCGSTADLEDIKYPFPKIIPAGDIRDYKPDEML